MATLPYVEGYAMTSDETPAPEVQPANQAAQPSTPPPPLTPDLINQQVALLGTEPKYEGEPNSYSRSGDVLIQEAISGSGPTLESPRVPESGPQDQ
jgi:hypothetical protein